MPMDPSAMADEMVTAMKAAWKQLKGDDFPGGDTTDAKVMFLAVAAGLLTYLKANPALLVSKATLTLPPASTTPVTVECAVGGVVVQAP